MKKVKSVAVVLVLAVITFFCLIFIENQMSQKYKRADLVMAVREVPKGTKFTDENIENYFKVEEVDEKLVTESSIRELKSLEKLYAAEKISAGKLVYKEDFKNEADEKDKFENPVTASIGIAAFSDGASGILRKGDVINIMAVDKLSGNAIDILPYNVTITDAFDSQGNIIQPGDLTTVAITFNFVMEKNDTNSFYEATENAVIKLSLVEN